MNYFFCRDATDPACFFVPEGEKKKAGAKI